MSNRLKMLARELFYCLPADSAKEIAKKLKARVEREVTLAEVHEVVRYIRDNKDALQWNCPHVKRGRSSKGRYFRTLVDGSKVLYEKESDQDKLNDGLHGTLSHTAKMTKHSAESLRDAVTHARASVWRDHIEGLMEEQEAVAKKAARILRMMEVRAA
jgi:hypothetical protein